MVIVTFVRHEVMTFFCKSVATLFYFFAAQKCVLGGSPPPPPAPPPARSLTMQIFNFKNKQVMDFYNKLFLLAEGGGVHW